MTPIILPKSLESRRKEFERTLIDAQRRVRRFAEKYGWKRHVEESFFDRLEIYDDKDKFDKMLLELHGDDLESLLESASVAGVSIPKEFSAGLEKNVLFAVSPELYEKNFHIGVEEDYYEKVLAHEIFHRLHIRILEGNEEAMGPIWFFEGFAIFAADQFRELAIELGADEIWEIIRSKKRGSYVKYKIVFDHFLGKVSLHELVKRAGDEDFMKWLEQLE